VRASDVTHCKRVQPLTVACSFTLPLALSAHFLSSLFPASLPVPYHICFAATTSNTMSDAMSIDGVHANDGAEWQE
jgi:hypothetical protein